MKTTIEYEQLRKDSAKKLVGGFSDVLSNDSDSTMTIINSHCWGGNCKTGCGTGKKYTIKRDSTIPNNCGAGKNCAVGCGKVIKK